VVFTENRILFKFKLEGNSIICKNIDKAGGHYAKWDKPGIKVNTLPQYICNQKEFKSERYRGSLWL
jgi:hypothetical protein